MPCVQKLQHATIDRREFSPAEIAARDAGLIGYHDDRKPDAVGGLDDRHDFFAQNDLSGIARIAGIDIDGAVAIEKEGRLARRKDGVADTLHPQPRLGEREPDSVFRHRLSGLALRRISTSSHR